MRLCAVALITTLGCTVPQAVKTRQVSELVAGGSIIVMIVASIVEATVPAVQSEAHIIAVASIPVTLFSVGTYIAADQQIPAAAASSGPAYQQSEEDNRLARSLAHDAALAARVPDCDQVRTLEGRVRDLDLNVHLAMLRNYRIVECLREPTE